MPVLDLSIVLVTLVTGIYCLVLNQRLKRLHDLKSGLGGAVTQLAQSVSQMKKESEAVSARMNAASDRVERLLVQVDACEPRIDTLLETMDRQVRQVWREDKVRMTRARNEMTEIKKDAEALATLLNDQLCLVAEQVEAAASAPDEAARSAKETDKSETRRDNVVRVSPAPQQADNPYSRRAAS